MADAQYVIDISATLSGNETVAELDALTAKLTGAGRRSDDFQSAIKRLSTELDAAKASSVAANAALAEGNAQYKLLEREALRAAKAVERAQGRGTFDPRAARAANEARVALDAYGVALKGTEQKAAQAAAAQGKLASQLKGVEKIASHVDGRNAALNQKYEKLGQVAARLPGPLGGVASQLVNSAKSAHGVSAAFSGAQVAAIALAAASVILVAAVVAVTVAVVAGYVALARYAVGQADAARSAALSREAFAALSAETAAGVGAFDEISKATGLQDAELVALTKSLRAAKVSAADMPAALRAAAMAEAALGKGGSSEFVARIQDGTLAVGDFAAEVESKFGGIVADQLRGLDAQSARFKKAWGKLFTGVELDPFLDAMSVLVGMFEKGHPLAEAFGFGVAGAINPIGPMALQAAYAVEAFALGFAIQLTKMYIAVKPALKWLGEFFNAGEGTGLTDTLKKAGEIAGVLAVVIGVALGGALAVVGGLLAITIGGAIAFGMAIYGVVNSVWTLLSGLFTVGAAIVEWATTVGVDLMMGLVGGITSTVSAVVGAVTGAVTSAIDTAKSLLGIASPSRVFMSIGEDTVAGFTGAVDAGAADAQGSMANLVGAPAAESPDAGAGAASEGGSKSLSFDGAVFHFHGVANAEQARDLFRDMLTRVFSDDADSLAGAAV